MLYQEHGYFPMEEEKVYVGIGDDVNDGFQTLEWALTKWSSQSITILILYAANSICRDYVYTPIGKLPSSSVNEEKLKDLEKYEEAKTDKILANYIAFCGKVKAEIFKFQKHDGSMENIMVDLISGLRITKLVFSLTFLKPLLWKSRSALIGLFHIHKEKSDFCELFLVFGGKLVFLIEENGESVIKDDLGVVIAIERAREKKKKYGFKVLLEKMLPETADNKEKKPCDSPSSSSMNQSEIELYFTQLSSSNAEKKDPLEGCVKEPIMPENMTAKEKIESLKERIRDVQEVVQLNKKEAKAIVERQAKAEWAIRFCASRAEDLEACVNEEMAKRAHIEEELDSAKEELYEVQTEVEEKRTKLNSILELQRELSSKLQLSSREKSHAEIQLERAVSTRTQMIRGIEKLRRQRDVLRRRIEFCREKDAIGQATRLKSGANWTNLNSERVAIKLYHKDNSLSEDFPSVFFCPIFQDIMKNPHVAADGFSYEQEAIEEWLASGCTKSPMTNLELKHKLLTPNHNLRSLIHDWENKRSPLPS